MIWVTVGILLVSFVISHAWWSVVRLVRLRQDIFDMRDGLFVVAMETGTFSDPAYTKARRFLNSVARIADSISVHTLAYALHADLGERKREPSNNAVLQDAIDRSLEDCTERIWRYLMRETFTGRIVLPLMRTIRMSAIVEEQLRRWIRRWLISPAPESLDLARHGRVIPNP